MKKINDSKIYLFFSLACLLICVILGSIFAYSAYCVEPEIQSLLNSEDNISENYKSAFEKLKDPQIFARYEYFDLPAIAVKSKLNEFSKKLDDKTEFTPEDKIYLEYFLHRRILGSTLTRNTMFFFLLLAVTGSIFYVIEIRKNRNELT